MTDKESTKTPSPARKRQRKNTAPEHESERFAPCVFALEKFLKEYSSKERSLQAWQRIKPH
ncbi:hypothetical protein [Escherichia coli]|uniref:hypothetical protein n=1 Tax=Escherichia coli TaxID=562 RepID=UPI00135DE6F5|nr:hypothetical protein [Escherichia coli]MXF07391.1 hypothetical protein [Escherichia coli]